MRHRTARDSLSTLAAPSTREGARAGVVAAAGALGLAALLLAQPARAQSAAAPAAGPPAANTSRPRFALGVRALGRFGQYHLGGVGGQLRLRPFDAIAIDLFADATAGSSEGALRHDTEIGGTLQFPSLLRGERWSVYPLVGACAMLVAVHPQPLGQAPAALDVRFGVHAGGGVEYFVHPRVSLQAHAEAVGYVGHDVRGYRWGGEVSQELAFFAVGQGSLAANYWFF